MRFLLLLFLLSSSLGSSLVAQPWSQVTFGKSRVQHKKLLWKYVSTYHFDIYYSYGGEDLARYSAQILEKDIKRLGESLRFSPYVRFKIMIYNSVTDLQQSNIGLDAVNPVGGVTEFVKPTLEVPFRGDLKLFQEELSRNLAASVINIMLYGGNLRESFKSAYLVSIPDWYLKGAARYLSEGWSVESDNYLRSLVLRKDLKNPISYSGKSAEIIGQSIWHYVAQKYSPATVGSIINVSRVYRNEKSSIEASLGISYTRFLKQWKTYYEEQYDSLNQYFHLPEEALLFGSQNRKGAYIGSLDFSLDGQYLAYTINNLGRFKVVVQEPEGKKKVLTRGGYRRLDQEIELQSPVLQWKEGHILSVNTYKKGELHNRFFDLDLPKRTVRGLGDFNQILSYDFTDDGKFALLSADARGKTDLYYWDLSRNNLRQITIDWYNDAHPIFVPGSSTEFLFCSNRQESGNADDATGHHVLYHYDLVKNKFTRLLELGDISHLQAVTKNEVYFLSDVSGIRNLYRYNWSTKTLVQLTNSIENIGDFSIARRPEPLIAYTTFSTKERIRIYLDTLKNYQGIPFSTPTDLGRLLYAESAEEFNGEVKEAPMETGFIDFDKLTFESDTIGKDPATFRPNAKNEGNQYDQVVKVKGSYPYKHLFGVDRVVTSMLVDPIRGFGIVLEGQMSDLMKNHHFNLGMFGFGDLRTSSVWAEYYYLKKRLDWRIRLDRQAFNVSNEFAVQRYVQNQITVEASYPLTVHSKLILAPFATQTRFTDITDLNTILEQDALNRYIGTEMAFVFDNTRVKGMNRLEGSRGKIASEFYRNYQDESKSFGRFYIDLRHYQPIHRELILAFRGSYGTFFGQSKKNYHLGGMDNWLFNGFDQSANTSDLVLQRGVDNSNLLFTRFAMPMRGFRYAAQSGNSHLMLNAEIRLPLVVYFYRRPISSVFFRNLQVVGFTDVGAAWLGQSPFSVENSLNTQQIVEPPFSATVRNFRSPFLIGYGFGARSRLMGFYMKGDVAWGIRENKQEEAVFYFTLGHDF
jgi:hypothetical protein